MGNNFFPELLDTLLGLFWYLQGIHIVFVISHPTQFQWCLYSVSMGDTLYSGLADSISRRSLTKYILSWSKEVLTQDVHTIVLVHSYSNIRQVTKTTKANATPEHNPLSGSAIAIQGTAGWAPLLCFPPDKYPPIKLINGHPELIAEYDLVQRPVIVQCPVLNHRDQRTPVLGRCRTRRLSRSGRSLLKPISRKRPMTSPTAAWLQHKSSAILR